MGIRRGDLGLLTRFFGFYDLYSILVLSLLL